MKERRDWKEKKKGETGGGSDKMKDSQSLSLSKLSETERFIYLFERYSIMPLKCYENTWLKMQNVNFNNLLKICIEINQFMIIIDLYSMSCS